jgi:molecular chaperone IbpA
MVLAKYTTSNISKLLNDIDKISIGLEPWFTSLDNSYTTSNYPPYNVVDMGDGKKRLEVAVAGFSKDEIQIYTERNLLTIESNKLEKSNETYHYNGIAKRSFRRSWTLSDDVRINEVKLRDGLLIIDLSTVIPEHQKKQTYFIN